MSCSQDILWLEGRRMKVHRQIVVGCGLRPRSCPNSEGYADPTAECAINGDENIFAAPLTRKPGEKEKTVIIEVPPVSHLDTYLEEYARNLRKQKRQMKMADLLEYDW